MAEPHVVSALIRKRGELAGEIEAAEKHVTQLRADLAHLDATLRIFGSAVEPGAIPVKRARPRRSWFRDGELPRRVLETLRRSPVPLTATEIAQQVMKSKGMPEGDRTTPAMIKRSVQRYLSSQRGKLAELGGRRARQGLWSLR